MDGTLRVLSLRGSIVLKQWGLSGRLEGLELRVNKEILVRDHIKAPKFSPTFRLILPLGFATNLSRQKAKQRQTYTGTCQILQKCSFAYT